MKTFTQWLALLAGTAVSLVANVEHMDGPMVARVLGASVPVLMAFGVHLSGGIQSNWARYMAWVAVGLAFFVSYQSSYELVNGWGMSIVQSALFPLVPEAVMIVALIGLAEGVTERRERRQADAQTVKDRQAYEEARQRTIENRQRPSNAVSTINGERQEPSNPGEKRQSIVSRMDEKRDADIRLMANTWPGITFFDIPESDRVRVVRKKFSTEEKTCGPDRAKRLVSIYMTHLESTYLPTTETQES